MKGMGTKVRELREVLPDDISDRAMELLSGVETDILSGRSASKRWKGRAERYKAQLDAIKMGDDSILVSAEDLVSETAVHEILKKIAAKAAEIALSVTDQKSTYQLQGIKAAQDVISKQLTLAERNTAKDLEEIEELIQEMSNVMARQSAEIKDKDRSIKEFEQQYGSAMKLPAGNECQKTH